MNQREGVFAAIEAVLGEVTGKVELNDTQQDMVEAKLFAMFTSGEIEYKGGVPDSVKLKKYIPGLINNWLRKDPNLNGNVKYTPKKPGSRTGSGDEQLKALKSLRSVTTDANVIKDIDAAITARQSELKPKVVVNASALPPHLRKYITEA